MPRTALPFMWFRKLAAVVALCGAVSTAAQDAPASDGPGGLVAEQGWELVRANCSSCHSIQLVTQNRMSATSWQHTIRWMQEKHNLWDLGENETAIITYLAEHYGIPDVPHRRRPLNQEPLE